MAVSHRRAESGNDSLRIFQLLNLETDFLALPATQWQQSPAYKFAKDVVEKLPCVNDAAERVLGLATDLNCISAPKDESQLQAMYKVVKGTRQKLHDLATSSEYVTKRSLGKVEYKW